MLKPDTLRLLRNLTAILVIFQLAFAHAMAASPELHHACDADAGNPGHECVVTMILNGGYTIAAPDILPKIITCLPEPMPMGIPAGIELFPSHLAGGVLAHAPPRGP